MKVGLLYTPWSVGVVMGLKRTSDTVGISFAVSEAVAGTAVEEQINLSLDVLNSEVFVVLGIDLDPNAPDQVIGLNTQVQASLTSTTQTGSLPTTLANTNCLAEERMTIRSDAANPGAGVGFRISNGSTPMTNLDRIGIIATDNFFVQVAGNNNIATKSVSGRLWGYRAKADASTYAALVQSEVLSA